MDHERTIDSDDILRMKQVPKSLIVLGAGAVGTEFASIFARFGSQVTLVELLGRVLPLEDEEISAALGKALQKQGIDVRTGTKVKSVVVTQSGVEVTAAVGEGDGAELVELTADHVLVATGRQPLTAGIGLENTAIEANAQGFVAVDPYMRTAEEGVYAVGDIVPTAMLAHLGSHEGILAVDHALGRECHPIKYDRVPSCTYCDPEVASVGLTEAEARARGYDVKTATFPFSGNGKAKILGAPDGFIKLVGEKRFDELLGVHIIGPRATEMIAESVVALNLEATSAEIAHSIHPHPTLSEAMGEVGHALHLGQPIHF
jgi:dihydrolipoamide dehydrogenase